MSLVRLYAPLKAAAKQMPKKCLAASKYGSAAKIQSRNLRSLSSVYLQKSKYNKRGYTSAAPFAQPSELTPDQIYSKVPQTTRPVGTDGFPRATPFQVFQDFREGVAGILVDIRPADEFANWHLLGSYNVPFASLAQTDLSTYPVHRPVYIISGGNPNHLPNAVVVAQAFTKLGVAVTIVEHGMKGFPDGGFMYYMDVDAEEARLKAIEAAKAAAAAAAQKK